MSAVISQCGLYRYRLERDVQAEGQVWAFFGINPSTADAETEDATTRKWRGFCLRNGVRRYIAGNVFAYRATDVRELASAPMPVGPQNDAHLCQIMRDADVLVPCWGNSSKVPENLRGELHNMRHKLINSGKPVKIFGLTKSLDPLHPLMLGYDTPLKDWAP